MYKHLNTIKKRRSDFLVNLLREDMMLIYYQQALLYNGLLVEFVDMVSSY